MILRVHVYHSPSSLAIGDKPFRSYKIDSAERSESRVLGEQCRNAHEGGQVVVTFREPRSVSLPVAASEWEVHCSNTMNPHGEAVVRSVFAVDADAAMVAAIKTFMAPSIWRANHAQRADRVGAVA